jgi:hypothetical protein
MIKKIKNRAPQPDRLRIQDAAWQDTIDKAINKKKRPKEWMVENEKKSKLP